MIMRVTSLNQFDCSHTFCNLFTHFQPFPSVQTPLVSLLEGPVVLSILLWPVQDSAPQRFVCHTRSHQHFSRSYSIESCGNCP